MATGGEFGNDNKGLDDKIDHDDFGWDDDWDNDQHDVNITRPFDPTTASTPYHQGEQHEMQTLQHEQSGLPSYDERTPLLPSDEDLQRRFDALRQNQRTGIIDTTHMMDTSINPLTEEDREKQIQIVKRLIKSQYPNAKVDSLVIGFSKKRPMDIVVFGPKGGETKIVLNDGSGLQQSFLNQTFVKKALGPPGREIINREEVNMMKRQKELEKERGNLKRIDEEIQGLGQRVEKEEAKIDQLKENQGPGYEEEMKRKKQLLKNLKRDFVTKQKEREVLQKRQGNIDQLQSSLSEENRKQTQKILML